MTPSLAQLPDLEERGKKGKLPKRSDIDVPLGSICPLWPCMGCSGQRGAFFGEAGSAISASGNMDTGVCQDRSRDEHPIPPPVISRLGTLRSRERRGLSHVDLWLYRWSEPDLLGLVCPDAQLRTWHRCWPYLQFSRTPCRNIDI